MLKKPNYKYLWYYEFVLNLNFEKNARKFYLETVEMNVK